MKCSGESRPSDKGGGGEGERGAVIQTLRGGGGGAGL